MKFEDMGINEKILKGFKDLGFEDPTEIQEKAIPLGLKGKDIIGKSMTGSGKTAAFGVPILKKIKPGAGIQALVVTPTRELTVQVAEHIGDYAKYMDVHITTVYGGVPIGNQIQKLRSTDIVVGTPGRLLDHMNRGTLKLNKIKVFVLDEADRMLDMGFIDDIRRIMSALPKDRQTLLFSATMPREVVAIGRKYMKSPEHIKAQPIVPKHKLKQVYYDVKKNEKLSFLTHLIKKEKPALAIVFCRTKRTVDLVADVLRQQDVGAKAIHSGFSQKQRENVLEGFHRGRIHVLVATNVAARGLDIQGITHIFNYDVPQDHKDYRHRIGRTARIGREGKAITILAPEDHESFRRVLKHNREIERGDPGNFRDIKFRMPPRGGGGRRRRR